MPKHTITFDINKEPQALYNAQHADVYDIVLNLMVDLLAAQASYGTTINSEVFLGQNHDILSSHGLEELADRLVGNTVEDGEL